MCEANFSRALPKYNLRGNEDGSRRQKLKDDSCWPANGNSARHFLVKIICFCALKQFSSGVYQLLGVEQLLRVTPKHWWTPFITCFFVILALFYIFYDWKGRKSCFSIKKLISTSICLLVKIHNRQCKIRSFEGKGAGARGGGEWIINEKN